MVSQGNETNTEHESTSHSTERNSELYLKVASLIVVFLGGALAFAFGGFDSAQKMELMKYMGGLIVGGAGWYGLHRTMVKRRRDAPSNVTIEAPANDPWDGVIK